MKLVDLIKKDCLVVHADLSDKDALLDRIAAVSSSCPALEGVAESEIARGLKEREQMGSTGFGDGIAIPHCRLSSVKDFVVGIVTLREGIEFDSLDGEPVRLAAFIIAPDTQNESDTHIRILAQISHLLQIPEAVAEMASAKTKKVLQESLLRHFLDEPSRGSNESDIMHVFIRDEDYFRDILQVFSSMDSSSALVVEAEDVLAYLGKMPLFSDFWSDSPEKFGRIIIAVVSRKMTNESIRRIERVVGPLDESSSVAVTVQKLFYCSGNFS